MKRMWEKYLLLGILIIGILAFFFSSSLLMSPDEEHTYERFGILSIPVIVAHKITGTFANTGTVEDGGTCGEPLCASYSTPKYKIRDPLSHDASWWLQWWKDHHDEIDSWAKGATDPKCPFGCETDKVDRKFTYHIEPSDDSGKVCKNSGKITNSHFHVEGGWTLGCTLAEDSMRTRSQSALKKAISEACGTGCAGKVTMSKGIETEKHKKGTFGEDLCAYDFDAELTIECAAQPNDKQYNVWIQLDICTTCKAGKDKVEQ